MSTITSNEPVKNLILELNSSKVEFEYANEFEIRIYEPDRDVHFQLIQTPNTIKIVEPEEEGDYHVVVYVADTLETVEVTGITSTLFFRNVDIENLFAHVDIGNIEINQCRIKKCGLESFEGDIIIDCTSGFEYLKINEYSGNVDVYTKGNIQRLKATSESGELDITCSGDFDTLFVETDSADVFLKIKNVEGIDLDATSEFGEVDNKIAEVLNHNYVKIYSESGHIKLRNS